MAQNEEKYQEFVEKAFEAANLPEVPEHLLETGTYTNAQIAEKFRDKPAKLLSLLMSVSKLGGGAASRRSVLSFAVDMDEKQR